MQAAIEYLRMDGYWSFIWPAYGFTAAVLIALLVASLRALRANEHALRMLESSGPRRSRRRRADAAHDA